jgi:hypothetical protein
VAVIVLVPAERLDPASVKVAVPAAMDAEPMFVDPFVRVTDPEETALPVEVFAVIVSCVDAVCAMVAGEAVMVSVGAVVAGVTVTVTEPLEAAKLLAPEYAAVMVLEPETRLVPLTVRVAVPVFETDALPSATEPVVKTTVPVVAL